MYCKWCGMESKDERRCEWCGRPFVLSKDDQPAEDQATTEVTPITTAVPTETTAIDPVPTETIAIDPVPEADPETTTAIPPMEHAPPVPYNPRLTGLKPIKIEVAEIPPFGIRIEKYLGIMTLLLAAGMAVAHYFPQVWLVPLFVLLFVSGLLLGSFRVIGYYDDEFLDVSLFLAMCALLGPVYATGGYLIICLIKQDYNWSLLGLLASHIVIRLAVGASAYGLTDTITYMATFNVAFGLINWVTLLFPSCLLIGGWMSASFTRPLNE